MRDVDQLSTDELLRLFTTLECPSLTEMHGEYRGVAAAPLRPAAGQA